jgi:hypothetical protein
MSTAQRYFAHYCENTDHPAEGRIVQEARSVQDAHGQPFFQHIITYHKSDLAPSFVERCQEHFQHERGSGYWCWRPQTILQVLELMKDGDELLYSDSGSRLDQQLPRLWHRLQVQDVVPFEMGPPHCLYEEHWTKMDLCVFLKAYDHMKSYQRSASFSLWRKNPETLALARQWSELACNFHNVSDTPSRTPNQPGFREHRYDQSIWSLLTKIQGIRADPYPIYGVCDPGSCNAPLSLQRMGTYYGTDKAARGFCDVYEHKFQSTRETVRHVLEVGVSRGASLKMWRDYFPQATIYGLDCSEGHDGYYLEWRAGVDTERIELYKLDQSREEELTQFLALMQERGITFDLVVDDGSHLMRDQQITLRHFFPLVRPGGFYVIEDVHTSLSGSSDVLPDKSNTTLGMIDNWHLTKKVKSPYADLQEVSDNLAEIDL